METKTVETTETKTQEERVIKEKKVFGPITVDSITPHKFKEDYSTIMVRQKVTKITTYPKPAVNNSFTSSLFAEDNIVEDREPYTSEETRVMLIHTKNTEVTLEQAQEAINKMSGAVLYKVLANHPIISKEDIQAIQSPNINFTKEDLAENQIVKYPKGHKQAGEIIVTNGKVQYRRVGFSNIPKEDEDRRNDKLEDQYLPEVIESMLNSTQIEGQDVV